MPDSLSSCTHSHFRWPAHPFTWSKGCWNTFSAGRCPGVLGLATGNHWRVSGRGSHPHVTETHRLCGSYLSCLLLSEGAVNLNSFHRVGIFTVVTICGIVLGVLRYSLHQLFALKYFVGELLLLRNGARWTVLRSKVLTLSADHGTSSGTFSSSSSVFLHHQPGNSGGRGHSRETNIRVTC